MYYTIFLWLRKTNKVFMVKKIFPKKVYLSKSGWKSCPYYGNNMFGWFSMMHIWASETYYWNVLVVSIIVVSVYCNNITQCHFSALKIFLNIGLCFDEYSGKQTVCIYRSVGGWSTRQEPTTVVVAFHLGTDEVSRTLK